MKRLTIVFMLISIMMMVCACTKGTVDEKYDDLPDVDYTISKINGIDYLIFAQAPKKLDDAVNVDISFAILNDMKNALINKEISALQKSYIYTAFLKDENGIPICDLDKLFFPVLPEGLEISKVKFLGKNYSFELISDDSVKGDLMLTDENGLNDAISNDTFYFENISVTKMDFLEDRKATVFYYTDNNSEWKRIEYVLENDRTKLIVKEDYACNDNNESNGIPVRIYIYGGVDDIYFTIELYDLRSRPDVEWLDDFSMMPYK